MFRYISNHIFINATNGIWKAKNNQDHKALNNNWIKNKFFVLLNVLKAEIDISKYRIGQTIPKTYPGGFRGDLIKSWYQTSSAVLEDARPPTMSARITYIKTENFEERNKTYLFLKNLKNELEISFKKVDPLGLASIKI